MGEEAKQLEGKPEEVPKAEEKKEEKAEDEKKEEKAEEEKKEEPKPPSPFVLSVDLHCTGCAKKIQRSILKIRGVEEVVIDMAQNQLTIKGVVEPQAVCTKIMKKAKRAAKVLSPLPEAEGEPIPEVVASQVSGLTTVELNVNMHCEACAEQLKRKILKMRGVRTAETDASSGKVTVTGTMDANKLVDYVYRRTKKQAKIVSQLEPEPEKPAEEPKPEEKPAEEAKTEEKKEEAAAEEKKDGKEKPPEGEKKEGSDGNKEGNNNANEEQSGENEEEGPKEVGENIISEEQMMQKMVYHHYQPFYIIERIPPPQLFSDENPNACCIT